MCICKENYKYIYIYKYIQSICVNVYLIINTYKYIYTYIPRILCAAGDIHSVVALYDTALLYLMILTCQSLDYFQLKMLFSHFVALQLVPLALLSHISCLLSFNHDQQHGQTLVAYLVMVHR